MRGSDLLWLVFDLLPLVFAVDLVAFHLTDDHPLAARWWWRRHRVSDAPPAAAPRCGG